MSGWDQGSVYVSSNSTKGDEESILPIANHLNPILDLTASQIVTNFSHFIQHFNRDNIFIYK